MKLGGSSTYVSLLTSLVACYEKKRKERKKKKEKRKKNGWQAGHCHSGFVELIYLFCRHVF